MVKFYCGVSERRWNGFPVAPGDYACVSPVYGRSKETKRNNSVTVPADTAIIQDSGAFSDAWDERLSLEAALERQVVHAGRYGYAQQVTHRASYDLLIDEVWTEGNRHKRRWTQEDAELAVDTTVRAAEFLARNRGGVDLILSAQGVTPQQYLNCVVQITPLLTQNDILGLGGWCITGKLPRVMSPVFEETILLVVPHIAKQGIKRIHIWGVIYAEVLGKLLWMCDQHGIALSTDSASPSIRPVFGNWGYADWTDLNYQKPAKEVAGLERARHVVAVREWLLSLRHTHYYKPPLTQPVQLSIWETSECF